MKKPKNILFRVVGFVQGVLDKIEKAKRITQTLSSFQKHFQSFLNEFRTIWKVEDKQPTEPQKKEQTKSEIQETLDVAFPKKNIADLYVNDAQVIEDISDTSVIQN